VGAANQIEKEKTYGINCKSGQEKKAVGEERKKRKSNRMTININ